MTVDEGNKVNIKLSSCRRYASVPVSTNESLLIKSSVLVLISLAVMILVDAGIANRALYCFSIFAFVVLFQIVVSIAENIFNTHIPPFCATANNSGTIHLKFSKRNRLKNLQTVRIAIIAKA